MSEPRHTKFYRDKRRGKLLGVCAGIADYTGLDVTLVRVITVLLTLFALNFGGVIAYLIIGWLTPEKPRVLAQESAETAKFWQGVRASPSRTIRDVRARFRTVDRRLADIEAYVTSANARLAREIDELR